MERIESFHGMTINEFCDLDLDGVFIIRVDGHLTCVIKSDRYDTPHIYDTWNCGEEIIDIVWRVE